MGCKSYSIEIITQAWQRPEDICVYEFPFFSSLIQAANLIIPAQFVGMIKRQLNKPI